MCSKFSITQTYRRLLCCFENNGRQTTKDIGFIMKLKFFQHRIVHISHTTKIHTQVCIDIGEQVKKTITMFTILRWEF